jgi:hypothetical protein
MSTNMALWSHLKKIAQKNKAKLRIHIRFTGRESDEQKAKKYRR